MDNVWVNAACNYLFLVANGGTSTQSCVIGSTVHIARIRKVHSKEAKSTNFAAVMIQTLIPLKVSHELLFDLSYFNSMSILASQGDQAQAIGGNSTLTSLNAGSVATLPQYIAEPDLPQDEVDTVLPPEYDDVAPTLVILSLREPVTAAPPSSPLSKCIFY